MLNLLEVSNLVVDRAAREVVHGVSMTLTPGTVTALLGANGAGKSSLVAAIGGVIPVRSGSVRLGGRQLLGIRPHMVRSRGVSVVYEGHQVLAGLSVRDNIRAAGLMLPSSDVEREIEDSLAIFPGLRERLDVDAVVLSGGQKQMVNIAQALICRPRFLLIDELSFGLAPSVVLRLGIVIQQIAQRGVGVLLIEQFTKLALSLADRAIVMERGRFVFDGSTDELSANPDVLHGAYLSRPRVD